MVNGCPRLSHESGCEEKCQGEKVVHLIYLRFSDLSLTGVLRRANFKIGSEGGLMTVLLSLANTGKP